MHERVCYLIFLLIALKYMNWMNRTIPDFFTIN